MTYNLRLTTYDLRLTTYNLQLSIHRPNNNIHAPVPEFSLPGGIVVNGVELPEILDGHFGGVQAFVDQFLHGRFAAHPRKAFVVIQRADVVGMAVNGDLAVLNVGNSVQPFVEFPRLLAIDIGTAAAEVDAENIVPGAILLGGKEERHRQEDEGQKGDLFHDGWFAVQFLNIRKKNENPGIVSNFTFQTTLRL